jgi:hypothetical protein
MTKKPLGWDVVRELARGLPNVKESRGRGGPSLTAGGKLMTCPAIHKSAEPDSLVVKVGIDQRAQLIAEDPEVYYVTDHYVNYPSVLVRMSRIHRDALRDLLAMAWRFVSDKTKPKKRPKKRRVHVRARR